MCDDDTEYIENHSERKDKYLYRVLDEKGLSTEEDKRSGFSGCVSYFLLESWDSTEDGFVTQIEFSACLNPGK